MSALKQHANNNRGKSQQTRRELPFSWRLRRLVHMPCIRDQDSLSWWAGMWSIPRWGQTWRVRPRTQTLAAGPWRPLYPWLHSADHNMKPTWTRPLPDSQNISTWTATTAMQPCNRARRWAERISRDVFPLDDTTRLLHCRRDDERKGTIKHRNGKQRELPLQPNKRTAGPPLLHS